ncbi:uncharacterized protein TNCV_4187961 [Trichonephila clavipes]|nr:uncharacterized protein TNCV_4187961 [Trichonephila clavipes]
MCVVNGAQNYLQTDGLDVHQCAQKILALQIVLEAKREEFVNDTLILHMLKVHVRSLKFVLNPRDELGGIIYLATQVKICSVIASVKANYAFLRPEVILSMGELNLDHAPQDINKEEYSNLGLYVYKLLYLQQT